MGSLRISVESFMNILGYLMLLWCLDESHNDISKSCEMVWVVRCWSSTENCVKTRYLDSAFMGHARENDLLVNFNQMTAKLDKSKIYHVSMDGPSVNHNFLRSLKRDWEKALIHKLIDIGTCNLHIISGAFKTGAEKSEWNIHKTLKGAFQIFHVTAARRDDYTLVTSSETFPMFFRLPEPADKLINIWPNIQKLWSWWSQQKPKSKQPCNLQTKSILNVKAALEDKLTTAKLHFFSFIAGKLHPFLVRYQTDKPMIPFLYRDMVDLMLLIVKKRSCRWSKNWCQSTDNQLKSQR